MSTEHSPPTESAPAVEAASDGKGTRTALTAVAFVAVAVLAATGGWFVASSVNQPTAAGSTGTTDTGAAAASAITIEYGEERGYDDARSADPLVSTEWLAEHLDDPNLVIIEVSEGRSTSALTSYDVGHIPGAVEFVWYRDFVQHLHRDLADQDQFTALAQSAGIDPDSTVVLYGDANNWFAAYGAWVFHLYGFDDVRLLDGGRAAWEAEGRTLEGTAPAPTAGTWEAEAPNSSIRAFQPEVLAAVNGEVGADIIDIRGPAEFNGEIGVAEGFGGEAAAKWGHVPGAVNAPWGQIVNQQDDGGDGTFKDIEDIRQHYADLGIDGSQPIIVYCRIGERASHTWYALSQLLGYDVALYDGSWTEWGNSVAVPVNNPTLEASGAYSGLWGGN